MKCINAKALKKKATFTLGSHRRKFPAPHLQIDPMKEAASSLLLGLKRKCKSAQNIVL